MAVRRWIATAASSLNGPVRVVLQLITAAAVVAGALWVSVSPGNGTARLPVDATRGASLQDVRPSATGHVNPKLAAAVDALLARRSKAVRTNDVRLFLRDVSPALQAEQRRLFTNLRAIGMTATFRRAEPWTDYEAQRRFGSATGTFRVSMRYQIRGSELAQAATDVGYTFSVRSRRLYLVDDDHLDQALRSGRQPWDFGPIKVVRRSNVLVIVDAGEDALAQRLADDTVQVAKRVRKLWPGPLQHVPLIVAMADRRVLTDSSPTLSGAEPAVVQAMRSPAAEARPVGGWIVINPADRRRFDRVQLAHVLVHLLPVRLGDQAPRWLAEGLAGYAANQQLSLSDKGATVTRKRGMISKQILGGLTALPADDAFGSTDSYDISWLAVEHLIKEVGLYRVTEFYKEVARKGYTPLFRENSLEDNTGFTEEALVDALRSLAR